LLGVLRHRTLTEEEVEGLRFPRAGLQALFQGGDGLLKLIVAIEPHA
jgi:hypothetical protein